MEDSACAGDSPCLPPVMKWRSDSNSPRFPYSIPVTTSRYAIRHRRPVHRWSACVVPSPLGFDPAWSKDPAIGYKLLNARSETVADKPSFRSAFKQRGAASSASGFYEWQKLNAKRKQPHFIRPRDGGLFSFAGLWERWNDPQGQPVETCSILTTEANELMRPLHDRMPVIVDPASDGLWLDPQTPVDALHALFVPAPSAGLEAYPVSSWVSNAKNQGPKCLEPAGA